MSALGSQQRGINSASTVPNDGIVWREALQTDSAPQEALQTASGQRHYKLWAEAYKLTLGRGTTDSGQRHYKQTLGQGTTDSGQRHYRHWAEVGRGTTDTGQRHYTLTGPRHYTLTLGRGTTNWLWAEALQTLDRDIQTLDRDTTN